MDTTPVGSMLQRGTMISQALGPMRPATGVGLACSLVAGKCYSVLVRPSRTGPSGTGGQPGKRHARRFGTLRIGSATAGWEQLTELSTLHLRGNVLTSLPDAIGTLPSLQTLDVAQNLLVGLPASVATAPSLMQLDISENEVKQETMQSVLSSTSLVDLVIFKSLTAVCPTNRTQSSSR